MPFLSSFISGSTRSLFLQIPRVNEQIRLGIDSATWGVLKKIGQTLIFQVTADLWLPLIPLKNRVATKRITDYSPWHVCLIGPFAEEVLFRGMLQTGIRIFQESAIKRASLETQNNRIFRFITSPSLRIFAVSAVFGSIHLTNAGVYLDTKDAIIQATVIFLNPDETVLYETTGNMIAPVAHHVAHNAIAYLVSLIANKNG